MGKTLTAVFDREILRPDQPVDLRRHTRYRITVEPDIPADSDASAWEVLESLIGSVDAPEDWCIEHGHYLYGTPKRDRTGDS